jgi:Holliday junction DNA helicase RuvA
MELYGFLTTEELEFFEQLLTVTSVGPKSALNILSVGKVEEIKKAIIHGDASILTKVSGIGQKTAERLILELKNKISIEAKEGEKVDLENFGDSGGIDALVNLGYRRAEAREALHKVDASITGVKERVKEALKMLGKR